MPDSDLSRADPPGADVLAPGPHGPGLTIDAVGVEDAGELLTLQRAAYVTEAQLYGDPMLPPLTETLGELRAALAAGTLMLAARLAGAHEIDGAPRIVGAVRARVDGDACHIGRLTVAPDVQGRGIGSALSRRWRRRHAGRVARFVLFTGHLSEGNLRLYRRHGYAEVGRRRLSDRVTEVHLAKLARRADQSVDTPADQRAR